MASLYRKYRPANFSQVTGQSHIIKTLTNAIRHNRVSHAYLFTGPRGTGKTTLARLFAKTLNCLEIQKISPQDAPLAAPIASDAVIEPCNKCESCKLIMENKTLDLIEIDAASHTGVDNIRQLKETVILPPSFLKYKIYIIDEVHMLSIGAFNALLKTLEEPPAHAIFILATTELHKVPETILSRCQRFDFNRLTQEQIIERLSQIASYEKVKIDKESLEIIALEAEGGMRDAESLLGQIIALEDKEITLEEVGQILGTSSKRQAIQLVEIIIEDKIKETLQEIAKIQAEGMNLKNLNKNILSYLRSLLILKSSPETPDLLSNLTQEQLEKAKKLIAEVSQEEILLLLELFLKSLNAFKDSPLPQLPLEMAAAHYHVKKNTSRTPSTPRPPQTMTRNAAPTPLPPAPRPAPKPTPPASHAARKTTAANYEKNEQENPTEETESNLPPATNIKIEDIMDKWTEILEGVKPHNHSIHAFLKNCIPCGILDGKLYIKTKYDFYKEKLSEVNNRLTVQRVIAKIIQGSIKVVIATEKECEGINFGTSQSNLQERNVLHDAMQLMGGRIVNNE